MKDYYQRKKTGYKLPKTVYAKTVKTIQTYDYYQDVINKVNNKSVNKITQKDIDNRNVAEYYINVIDHALITNVHKDYQKPIFDHLVRAAKYIELEELYHFTTSTMKRWTQRFVYGVAKELGEVIYE